MNFIISDSNKKENRYYKTKQKQKVKLWSHFYPPK